MSYAGKYEMQKSFPLFVANNVIIITTFYVINRQKFSCKSTLLLYSEYNYKIYLLLNFLLISQAWSDASPQAYDGCFRNVLLCV